MLIYPKSVYRSGVYLLVNCNNGRVYIGSTYNLTIRFQQHGTSFKSGSHQAVMQEDWDRGHDFYAVVLPGKASSDVDLRLFEAFWIARMQRLGYKTYNAASPSLSISSPSLKKLSDTIHPFHLPYIGKRNPDDNAFLADIEMMNNLISCLKRGKWGLAFRLYQWW